MKTKWIINSEQGLLSTKLQVRKLKLNSNIKIVRMLKRFILLTNFNFGKGWYDIVWFYSRGDHQIDSFPHLRDLPFLLLTRESTAYLAFGTNYGPKSFTVPTLYSYLKIELQVSVVFWILEPRKNYEMLDVMIINCYRDCDGDLSCFSWLGILSLSIEVFVGATIGLEELRPLILLVSQTDAHKTKVFRTRAPLQRGLSGRSNNWRWFNS